MSTRSKLRFVEQVLENFSFLNEHGFKVSRSEPTFMQFKNRRIVLSIFHGRKSFEIGLEIAPIDKPEETYPFNSILALAKITEPYRVYQTQSIEGVADGVRQLARLSKLALQSGVLEKNNLFVELESQSTAWRFEYAQKQNLQLALRVSEEAWTQKDFGKVIEILAPLRDQLSLTDINRLDYAIRHSSERS